MPPRPGLSCPLLLQLRPMRSANCPRLVVLGLDGLPFSLARSLCQAGKLPHLNALAFGSSHQARPIRAELPELSPVNWTSFFTGQGPETHGVFGFTRLDPVTYDVSLVDSRHVACPTLFDRLGGRGMVSKVVNLPNTYPARPLKGALIAGFVALELTRAVYPPYLAGPLAKAGYRLEADTHRGSEDTDFLLGDLRATLASRRMALDMFWPDLDWDLFVFVLTETDRLFHFLFPALLHEEHPLHGPCLEFLAEWDELIGEVLRRYHALPEPKRLMVMADHGFAELKVEVDLNVWLQEQGLLQLDLPGPGEEGTAGELAVWRTRPESRALALDPGRIYIHDTARFARGPVPPHEISAMARALREALLRLTWQGEPVMQEVHLADELYPGPMRSQAPDLVCEPNPGFDLKAKFNRREIFGHFCRTGTHTAGDVFFYDSAGDTAGDSEQVSRVRDIGAEVLRYFGLDEAETPTGIIRI